ncbi:probable pectinesterase 66 [Phoenix dactylifera]|uniref:pectinesterase n=1 Tax=Phoenix dactylifera TaxID=42345 RepID=A0A8B9AU34_PHODC|nr:probable pectinesterase 66 [Phoenix dactylifera]
MQSPFFFLLFLFTSLTQIFLYYDSVDGYAVISKNITVDAFGHGDFTTIQRAIDSVPDGNKQWIRIHVVQGIYREKVFIPSKKEYIFLEGEGHQQTSVEWDEPARLPPGRRREKVFIPSKKEYIFLEGQGHQQTSVEWDEPAPLDLIKWNNTSLPNSVLAGETQGVTFSILANNFVVKDIAFKKSTLHSIMEGAQPGRITAHGKPKADAPGGFVFKDCRVDGGKTFLGRAWNSYSTVVFHKTYMGGNVVPEGWDAWKTNGHQTTYAENSCSGPDSDATQRLLWKKLGPQQLEYFTNIKFIDKEGWLSQQP